MNKPSAIIFDYGDTLVKSNGWNIDKGIKKVLEVSDNPNNVTSDEIIKKANELYKEITLLNKEFNIEINFKNFYRYIFESFDLKFKYDYDQIEHIYRNTIIDYEPTEGMPELLKYLKNNNIKTAILSNLEFTAKTLSHEITRNFPSTDFEFIITSADYCYRKPSGKIFSLAKRKMHVDGSEIWFAGDSIEYDIIGAVNSGMIPIWYNPDNKKGDERLEYIEIKNWNELIRYIESL